MHVSITKKYEWFNTTSKTISFTLVNPAKNSNVDQTLNKLMTCAYLTSRSVSFRMFIRLRSVFTGSWGGGAAYGNWTQNRKHILDVKYMLWDKRVRTLFSPKPNQHSSSWPQQIQGCTVTSVRLNLNAKGLWVISTDAVGADKCWVWAKKKCSNWVFSGTKLTLQVSFSFFSLFYFCTKQDQSIEKHSRVEQSFLQH